MIITTVGNITSGFMVDQMQGILTLAVEDIERENKDEMKSEFIKGILTLNEKLVIVINKEKLFIDLNSEIDLD